MLSGSEFENMSPTAKKPRAGRHLTGTEAPLDIFADLRRGRDYELLTSPSQSQGASQPAPATALVKVRNLENIILRDFAPIGVTPSEYARVIKMANVLLYAEVESWSGMWMSPSQRMNLWLLCEHENFRTHGLDVFKWNPAGAWVKLEDNLGALTRTAEVMTALEGFLIQTHQKNADAKWDFREMKRELLADVRRAGAEDSLIAEYVAVARSNADYGKKITNGRTYHCPNVVKFADCLRGVKQWLEVEAAKKEPQFLEIFAKTCEEPYEPTRCMAFTDVFINGDFERAVPRKSDNCYRFFPYPLDPTGHAEMILDHMRWLDMFLDAFYFDNHGYKLVRMSHFALGLSRKCTHKVVMELSKGGVGKGTHYLIDEATLGGSRANAQKQKKYQHNRL